MASPLPLTNITTTGAQRVPRGQRAKCYGSGHCLEQTIFHARLSRHSYMRGQHARLSFVADDRLQHARHSYVSSIARSIQLSQRRGVSAFPPLVPTRSLDHLLRFSKACPRAGILLRRSASFWHRAHALLALCSIFDPMLIWWLQARIVYLSTRSAPQSDRSPHEGASCTTFEPVRLFWNTRIQKQVGSFSVVSIASHIFQTRVPPGERVGGPGFHLPGEWPGRHPRLAAQDLAPL